MPGPQDVIRTAVTLPWAIARRVIVLGFGLLPGSGAATEERAERPANEATPDIDPQDAAAAAVRRERGPEEEAIFTPDDDFFDEEEEHVEQELEVVAESADPEVDDTPGPQLHVDEPWDGYRRMKVSEIVTRLEGQPAEVLAAVELYETTHRKRRGVLEAVESATRA